jgi:hypothetical protein
VSVRAILEPKADFREKHLERSMKNSKTRLAVLLSTLALLTSAYAQLTPSGDAYTNTATPTTNYGAKTLLGVESSQTTFIQFNLSSIPAGYTGANVTKATLKLYVNTVTTAGSFNVDFVNGTWSESTIDANNAPALGTTIAASVPLATTQKNQYILIDITPAVEAWLNGSQANDGIALVGNSPVSATFDSKESTSTSHPAELDIVFAGIAGVTTASGSGLIGGGASGTLNLALTNACAANQVLQWNGTSWICASAATGTVTSVGSGTGLTGGPITGSGTLSLAPNACAFGSALSALPFTCFPFATLGANNFTASQSVTGNLSVSGEGTGNIAASGTVAGTTVIGTTVNATSAFTLGGSLFGYGSSTNGNVYFGFGGSNISAGSNNLAVGLQAFSNNISGTRNVAVGDFALSSMQNGSDNTAVGYFTESGSGSFSTAIGFEALSSDSTGASNTAMGFSALSNSVSGSFNTAIGNSALFNNTKGSSNTALGINAGSTSDSTNLTASNNTAVGATSVFLTGTITNATALGANAEVDGSNSMVLGSIAGVNGGTSNVKVGIGTTAPGSALEVSLTNSGGLGPSLTLTNGGIGPNTGSSLDFNTFPPVYGAKYNPTARILATDDGHFSSNLIFSSNTPDSQNSGLRTNMTISSTGNVAISGTLSKGAGTFKIDHPLDPANKYLYHSFVESPDMMNVYNGNIVTNQRGIATVILPDYFEALNRDFRYQLTVIGQFAQAIVAKEINRNRFMIKTSKPGVKVSWQVTGVRHDAYAEAHRIQVEEEKPPQEQGHYLHPELFGAPPEQAVGYHAPAIPTQPTTQAETTHVSSLKTPPVSLR